MIGSSRTSKKSEHPVRSVHDQPLINRQTLSDLNWDDLKLFLHVARQGSLRAAAHTCGVSVNTVRARLSRLEDRVGQALVMRSHEGVTLTPTGIHLQRVTLTMHGAADADSEMTFAYLRRENELRIGASEALGSGWLTPRLLDLQGKFPNLTMVMMCDNDIDSDRSDDLDLGIVWQMPRNADLIVSKLATLHFMPFASPDYIERHGVPRTGDDLLKHRFIEQISPGIKSELLDQLVGSDRPPGFMPIRTNSSLAVFWAVANGAGIAFMPTYAAAVAGQLVPIDLPFRLKFDIFYCFHEEARSSRVVMAGVDWLKDCFNPVLYPWFRSEFMHPKDFRSSTQGNVISLFERLTPAINFEASKSSAARLR